MSTEGGKEEEAEKNAAFDPFLFIVFFSSETDVEVVEAAESFDGDLTVDNSQVTSRYLVAFRFMMAL